MLADTLNGSIRIMVISQSPLMRVGLASIIDQQPNLSVVGQVEPTDNFLELLDIYRPQVAVWEMGWEPLQYVDTLTELNAAQVPTLALIINNDHAVNAAALLIQGGARGVLLQDTDAEHLHVALTALSHGLVVLTPEFATAQAANAITPALMPDLGDALPPETLTPRESEVLHLIAEGLPNKIIAMQLSISEHTVKFHVNAILTKLGAQSRTEAVVRATRAGLISL